MATLYISEAVGINADANGFIPPLMQLPPVAEQTVAIGATSAQSAAFGSNTNMIRLESDTACSVSVGVNPTATASKMRLAADSPEYFRVASGHKIAVIANT